jgi:hypothetical protein
VERDISKSADETSVSESLNSIRPGAGFDRVAGRTAAAARVRDGELVTSDGDGEAAAREREGEPARSDRDGDAGARVGDAVVRERDGEAAVARVRNGELETRERARRISSRARSCSRLRCVIGGTVSPKLNSSCRNC